MTKQNVYLFQPQYAVEFRKENTYWLPYSAGCRFKDYEIQRMRRDLDWMKEGSKLNSEYVKLQHANFYRFFNEHDLRRKTDFLTTFPGMKEFWNECRYHALQ